MFREVGVFSAGALGFALEPPVWRRFVQNIKIGAISELGRSEVTLEFIGMHLKRLTTEVASLRNDMRVVAGSCSASTTATATC